MTGLQVADIDLSDALDGFENASPSGGGNYIRPGSYLVMCKQCEVKKGYRGISFIGSNTVVKVIRDDGESNPEGAEANVVENLTKNKSVAQANMKAYLLALCEGKYQKKINHKTIKPEFIPKCCAPEQPLRGVYAFVEAVQKKREGKSDVTIKNWRMATNEELAEFGLKQPGT
jgi:hypothetical protein